eukprot:gene8110-1552_t
MQRIHRDFAPSLRRYALIALPSPPECVVYHARCDRCGHILSCNGFTLAAIGLPVRQSAGNCDICDEELCVLCCGGMMRRSGCDACIDHLASNTPLPFDWDDHVDSARFVPPAG